MKQQLTMFESYPIENDVVYTPDYVALDIINWLNPAGKCLDPCKGDGAFLKYLPDNSDWCEIQEGKNFFDYSKKVAWIVSNPPYSIFEDFLTHSFSLAENVAFIVPTNKIFQRRKIMDIITKYGGIKGLRVYGSGTNIGFPFGFSVGTFYFAKGYNGPTEIIFANPLPNYAVQGSLYKTSAP